MSTSFSVFGFLFVAALIGLLEWQSDEPTASNELVITGAQRAFVREQTLQAGAQTKGTSTFDHAMQTYIDEEILYREGLKLGLDKDDLIVKRRVVQKMRFLLEDMTPVAPPTQEQLEVWLQQNPQRYQTEQTVRFEHHFFSRGKRGDEAVYQAAIARQELGQGKAVQSDPFPLQADRSPVSKDQIIKDMGSPVGKILLELPLEQWSAPVQSSLGVHLFKVLERHEGHTMTVEQAGNQLRSDLMAAQRETVNAAGLAALRSTYTIKESE
ncbi:peptidylprolyl isomerase [uncultured Limnobacter sp.]|uniref:peptidylprolyl isomerase n=1 Tax=uncultured Limnobacter sp. TaxID=199681 RepID=UPI0030F72671